RHHEERAVEVREFEISRLPINCASFGMRREGRREFGRDHLHARSRAQQAGDLAFRYGTAAHHEARLAFEFQENREERWLRCAHPSTPWGIRPAAGSRSTPTKSPPAR